MPINLDTSHDSNCMFWAGAGLCLASWEHNRQKNSVLPAPACKGLPLVVFAVPEQFLRLKFK